MDWAVWGPPLVVLALGAVGGVVAALRLHASPEASRDDDRRLALEARRASLLEQLRELDVEAGKVDPSALAARREALVDEAARVLESLDAPVERVTSASAAGPVGRRRTAAVAGWLAGAVVFVALVAVVLPRAITPRPPMNGAPAGPQAELAAARARLERDPDDIDLINEATHWAIQAGEVQPAMELVDRARELDPNNPGALVNLAALQLMVGMLDRAEATLRDALARNPGHATGWLYLGVALCQQGEVDPCREALDTARRTGGRDEREVADALLAELARQEAMGGGAMLPADTEPAEPAVAEVRLSGTVRAEGPLEVPAQASLFVYARASEATAGPPLAVIKRTGVALPADFRLTDADRPMVQGPWPDQVWLQARIDLDGNALTREDVLASTAVLGPFPAGQAGVELVLAVP